MKIQQSVYLLQVRMLLLLLPALCAGNTLRAQQVQQYNRFQYHRYEERVLHTAAFHLYFPKGYDSLASFASVQLPDIIAETGKAMGTGARDVPHIVIYPSIDQLYESNIGLYEQDIQTFPTINLKGNRILVAFNGSWEAFRMQLKEAWVRLIWEEQFRQDAEEQLTNKRQLMPAWFKNGCIRFFARDWSAADESRLYDLLEHSRPQRWDDLVQEEPQTAGQAFCYYLCRQYREDAAMQVLFQLRQGKSLTRSVRLVTKRNLDTLTSRCLAYYRQRSLATGAAAVPASDTLPSLLEQRFHGRLVRLTAGPAGQQVCFVIQQDHQRLVYVTDRKTLADVRRKIKPFIRYRTPPWLEQETGDPYPLIGWEENGRGLYMLLPEKGHIVLKFYDAHGNYRDKYTLYGVDGAGSVQPQDREHWLLSAFRRGKSDIVLFDTRQLRYTTLTADIADHTQPQLNGGLLVYRSGYPADSLYHRDTTAKTYGLYTKEMRAPFKQMAGVKDKPLAADSAWVRWQVKGIAGDDGVVLTDTRSGMLQEDTVSLLQGKIPEPGAAVPPSPWLKDYQDRQRKQDSIAALLKQVSEHDTRSVLSDVLSPGSKASAQLQRDSLRRALAYTPRKVRPYMLQLYNAYFSAQVNNDYYINRYQPYQAYLGTFKFPEAGAMAQGGFSDLFDNHHFNIGYRLPAGTEGSDFFARYENTARKLDWHFLFFRKVESLKPDPERDWKDNQGNPYPQAAKVKTHYYELGFHYPLHYDWSLDFTEAARRDRTIFLATDRYSLQYEALQSWWSISSLALKVNKLKPTLPFLYKGWEGRAMIDLMASTGKQSTIVYGTQLLLAWHQPLLKGITFVAQAQAGYSGGQSRILYNFGGLDNNIVPRTDTSVHFAQTAPYAFQTLITPLRGYVQNSLYGSSFGLLNMDLYFPLFRSLIPLHTGFSSLNNLQLGLFTDIAAAATPAGLPVMPSPRYAYGCSARTMLAGYPIRFDIAWPGAFDRKPVWYLSLTLK